MLFLNKIGLTFIIIGVLMGTYYSFEWYKGISSAQNLTTKELKHLETIESKSHLAEVPTNSQVPSSQMSYKKAKR